MPIEPMSGSFSSEGFDPAVIMHAGELPHASDVPDLASLLENRASNVVKEKEAPKLDPARERDFLSFFDMIDNPFSDSVNPAFFYRTDAHDLAFIRMMMVIEHDVSLGLVTGVSGTGKTLVSQMILKNLDPSKYLPALVLVCPNMSKMALLREILHEAGVPLPEPPFTTHDLLKLLSDTIIRLHEKGEKLVVLIDECHFLSAECLHILRTISNIEIPERKLVTCILFGEQKFLKRLENPSYESLRNRMYLRSELGALEPRETEQYMKFRLMVVGGDEHLFDASALAAIHAASGGICRGINRLCMQSMIQAFTDGKRLIDEAIVAACVRGM
jgi:type II secretory pathway predicted ATPase ExeA